MGLRGSILTNTTQFYTIFEDSKQSRLCFRVKDTPGLKSRRGSKEFVDELFSHKDVCIEILEGSKPADLMSCGYFWIASDRFAKALQVLFPECVALKSVRPNHAARQLLKETVWWLRVLPGAGPQLSSRGYGSLSRRALGLPPEFGLVFDHDSWNGRPLFSLEGQMDSRVVCTVDALDHIKAYTGFCIYRVEDFGHWNRCVICGDKESTCK